MAGRDNFAYEYTLLARVAIASTVSLAHWHEVLQIHKDSGNPIAKRVQVLLLFVVANAVAASFQIIGAVVIYGLSFADVGKSELRQGIVLVRLFLLTVLILTRTGLYTRTSGNVDRSLHGQPRESQK